MRVALGKEGGREKKWVSSLQRGEDEQVQEKEMSQTLVGGWGTRRGETLGQKNSDAGETCS